MTTADCKQLRVCLPREAMLPQVEDETRRIRALFAEASAAEEIILAADPEIELDTSFLQLTLSMMKTAEELGLSVTFADGTEKLQDLCALYGIKAG